MNKQQRYMSLLLLASVVSGAKGMEGTAVSSSVEAAGGAAPQLTVDKYTVLNPNLSDARRGELQGTVNWVLNEKDKCEMLSVHSAAQELDIDDRTPDTRQTAKENWGKVKALFPDRAAAAEAVDYLTDSDDEEDVVKLVRRRDGHLVKQAARFQALAKEKAAVKAVSDKQDTQLSDLLAIKQPLDTENEQLATQETELNGKQKQIGATQEALESIVDEIVSYINVEDTVAILRDTPREKLVPVHAGELAAEKERLAQELAKVIAAKAALQDKITPVASEIEKLTGEQQATSAKQTEIAQWLAKVQHAETLAKTDREKLLARLNQTIELAEQETDLAQLLEKAPKAQTFEQTDRDELLAKLDQTIGMKSTERELRKIEAADLAKQTPDQMEAAEKTALIEAKKAKAAEIAKVIQTIANLKLARAQADNTYTWWQYQKGVYNGDK